MGYDRWTFQTACLVRAKGLTGAMGAVADVISMGNHKCVYIGHHGEAQPYDIRSKSVNYGVYFMTCPSPLLSTLAAGLPSEQERRQSAQSRYSDFLTGPHGATLI